MDDYEDPRVRRLRRRQTVEDLTTTEELFHVCWFDPDDNSNYEIRYVTAQQAMLKVKSMLERPAARIGIFKRIIITDGGDNTVFEWKHGHGITYPTQEMRDAHARANQG